MSNTIFSHGRGGHHHGPIVDHDFAINRRDLRTSPYNRHRRSNIRDRNQHRTDIPEGTFQQGTEYDDTRECATCGLWKPRSDFCNLTVAEKNRDLNGLNIHCRACQPEKIVYSNGYKVDDFVCSSSESEDEWSPPESETEESDLESEEEESN